MNTRRRTALTLVLSAFAAHAGDFKTGLWEFSSDMTGPSAPVMPQLPPALQAQMEAAIKQLPPGMSLPEGMELGSFGAAPGGGMRFSVKQCMKDENGIPPIDSGQLGSECKATSVEHVGNTVNWVVNCDGPTGVMTGKGTATYTGSSMQGSMSMKGTAQGQPLDMTINTTGRHVGACK